ncbi:nicotinamide riboside transporter PnuC [Blattabacterium cuenoti]|uniref:nicotinamide riboside transporter PnuC n=1 Tax=Blattabacterium cuenoti TaxID=1653831 RepID=UPI00163C1253|nr:nicotinamide riboside transporter PnuC [Blattabacterium cuenoti]
MNEWIHIFLSPNRSLFHIFLEFSAATLSIFSVIFAQNNNIWLYPIGIGSTMIYSYLTFITSLYGDCIINLYYTGMSLYGWYSRKNKKNHPIAFSRKKDYFYTALLFVSTCIFSTMVYYYFNEKLQSNSDYWTDGLDVFTTGIFFSGMYQMAMKKVESWIFWIIGNIISVPIYFLKGLVLTGFLFIFLVLLAIEGYVIWKKQVFLHKKNHK